MAIDNDWEELYKTAINTRQFEIQMFWQRSNYFLVLDTTAAIGFFVRSNQVWWHSLLLTVFGLGISYLWFLVNLGSRFWHVRWEHAAHRIEATYAPKADLFDATEQKVMEDFDEAQKWRTRPSRPSRIRSLYYRYRDWIDTQVRLVPSVSFAMINLPIIFMLLWAIAFLGTCGTLVACLLN